MEKRSTISLKLFIPGIAWFFIVALLTLMPGEEVPDAGWLNIPHLDKLVHAFMFGGLTFLFGFPYTRAHMSVQRKKNRLHRIAFLMIIWGLVIEVIQKNFIPGRGFEWMDLAADAAGVLLALILCNTLVKYFERRQKKQVTS